MIKSEGLIENAASLGSVLAEGVKRIQGAAGGKIGYVASVGLVGCLQFTLPGTTEPDPEPAWTLVERAVQQGVMMFAPVGVGGSAVKINPPLMIEDDALSEGIEVIEGIAAAL